MLTMSCILEAMSGRPTAPIQPHELAALVSSEHHYHPAQQSRVSGAERTLDSLAQPWDGQHCWAIVDGMWRQASILATAPSLKQGDEWTFIIETKHTGWRHSLTTKPVDDTDLEFEFIQVTDFVPLPVKQGPDGFELIHSHDEDNVLIRGHECPVHPYVAIYIRKLHDEIQRLNDENSKLRKSMVDKEREAEDKLEKERKAARNADEKRRKAEAKAEVKTVSPPTPVAVEDERLPIALREIENLRHELISMNGKYEGKVSQVNVLQSDLNKLSEKVDQLLEEMRLARQKITDQRVELDDLRATTSTAVSEATKAKRQLNQLIEEDKMLRDRLLALDEALQKTVMADTVAAHDQAAKHARDCADMQAEIDRLRTLLTLYKDGNEETLIVSMDKEAIDRLTAEKERLQEDVKELRYLLSEFRALDIRTSIRAVNDLSQRMSHLERLPESPALDEGRDEEDMDSDKKYGLDRHERKAVRDRIRLASRMQEEIARLKVRMEAYEKARLAALSNAVAPPNENIEDYVPAVAVPAAWTRRVGAYTMMTTKDLAQVRLNEAKLVGDVNRLLIQIKAKKQPTASPEQVEELQAEVQLLQMRLDDLEKSPHSLSAGGKYKPSWTRSLRALRSPHDGNYPWLETAKVHDLEKEVAELKKRLAFAKNSHKETTEAINLLIEPVKEENLRMRQRLKDCVHEISTLKMSLEKAKADAAAKGIFW